MSSAKCLATLYLLTTSPARDHALDLLELLLGCLEQGLALVTAQLRQIRIAASDQALGRKVGVGELEEILLVEQPQLKLSRFHQRSNLTGLERCDPRDPILLLQLVDGLL